INVFEAADLRLPEQKKIATVLLKIQRAIETQEKIIQSLRDLKKSTMQHLFTYGLRGEKTKMTEIGEIPESWEVVPLEKMYQITKKPRETTYTEFESIAFIPMECIPSFELFINEWRMKSPDQLTSGTYFEAGDLLLSKITPCFENGKQGIAKGIPNGFGIATTEVIPIKCLSGVSNIVFLSFYLQNVQVRLAIAGKMEGATGRQRVPVHLIRNWPIPFPATLKEQIDIANMLLSLDNKVSWHHTKKAALQSLFKTTLNKLMTGDIRVADLDIDVKEVEV
ncbi:MAG: restriction endonuclease subunit S, partial [Verrucomicrobiota bacterium]